MLTLATLSHLLRTYRHLRRIALKDVQRATKLHTSSISHIERGLRFPTATLLRFYHHAGLDARTFLTLARLSED